MLKKKFSLEFYSFGNTCILFCLRCPCFLPQGCNPLSLCIHPTERINHSCGCNLGISNSFKMWIMWLVWSAISILHRLSVVIPYGKNDFLAISWGLENLNLSLHFSVTTTNSLAWRLATQMCRFPFLQINGMYNGLFHQTWKEADFCHPIENLYFCRTRVKYNFCLSVIIAPHWNQNVTRDSN